MSIWTSNPYRVRGLLPRALLLSAMLPLAACFGDATGENGQGFLAASGNTGSEPLDQLALFGGSVIVAGPPGYCIDAGSVKRGPGGGFALIASCESLSGRRGRAVAPAVMTVTVLPRRVNAQPPTPAEIASPLAPAKALHAEETGGVSIVRMSAGGDRLSPDGDPRHWRAGILINNHLVSLAVYGPKNGAVTGDSGRRLILALAGILQEKSPAPRSKPVASSTTDAAVKADAQPKGLAALLGGLFPESK